MVSYAFCINSIDWFIILACTDGDIRLVGGDFDNEGTIEVCMSNIWGLVSDNTWNSNNSRVVCRQLGYTDGSRYKWLLQSNNYFNSGYSIT